MNTVILPPDMAGVICAIEGEQQQLFGLRKRHDAQCRSRDGASEPIHIKK
jgi:hypothetical protein